MMKWSQERFNQHMAMMHSYSLSSKLTSSAANPAPLSDDETPDKGPESKLQAKIMKWALDKGYPVFHDRSRKKNVPGWPDLTICLSNAIVLFLELKSAKGVMRPEQKHIRQQMIFLGHRHYVVKSYKKFLEIMWDVTHDFDNIDETDYEY